MSFAWGYKYQLVFTKIEYTMTAQCSVSTAGYVLLMAKFFGEVIFDIVFVQQLFYSEKKPIYQALFNSSSQYLILRSKNKQYVNL